MIILVENNISNITKKLAGTGEIPRRDKYASSTGSNCISNRHLKIRVIQFNILFEYNISNTMVSSRRHEDINKLFHLIEDIL